MLNNPTLRLATVIVYNTVSYHEHSRYVPLFPISEMLERFLFTPPFVRSQAPLVRRHSEGHAEPLACDDLNDIAVVEIDGGIHVL